MNSKKLMIFVILLSLMGLLAGCDSITATATPASAPDPVVNPGVIAEANLVPAEEAALSFMIPGQVSAVLVQEGDYVETGAVLARLGDVEALQAQAAAAELAVLQANQSLTDLQENADLVTAGAQIDLIQAQQALVEAEKAWDVVDTEDFQEDLDDARLDVTDAEADLEDAQEALTDYEDLDEDHALRKDAEDAVDEAQQVYDEALWTLETLENRQELAKAQLTAAQAALAQAERDAAATAGGVDADDLALAQSNLDAAQAQLAAAQSALTDAVLTAPFAGNVVKVDLIEGVQTSPGQLAILLADFSTWYLETTDLTENEVVQIAEGDSVSISFDALPGVAFTGEVESISDYFVEQFGDITYRVRIRLLEPEAQLRWGMTAEVHFDQ